MVFNNNVAYLWYFFVVVFAVGCKTKTIGTNNHACMYGAISADYTITVNFCPGINSSVIAYLSVIAYKGMRINFNIITQAYILTYVSKCSHVAIFTKFGTLRNK